MQAENLKIKQIVSEFFAKSLRIVLESRIPFISAQSQRGGGRGGDQVSFLGSAPPSRMTNRWFNLQLENHNAVQDSAEPWRRGDTQELMVVSIFLQHPTCVGGDAGARSRGQRFLKGRSPKRNPTSRGDSWSENDGESFSSQGGISPSLLERSLRQLSSVGVTPSGGIHGRRGVHVVSLTASIPNSPLFGPHHSWSGSLNKVIGHNGDQEPPLGVRRPLHGSPGFLALASFRAPINVSSLLHNDMDDGDFALPFAIDYDEADEYRSVIERPVIRQKTADTFESLRQPGSMGLPHAAVGDLVRILRSAPRLQQLSAPLEKFSDLASGKLVMGSPQVPGSTHTSPLGIPVGSSGMGKVKGIPPKPGATGMPNLNSGSSWG